MVLTNASCAALAHARVVDSNGMPKKTIPTVESRRLRSSELEDLSAKNKAYVIHFSCAAGAALVPLAYLLADEAAEIMGHKYYRLCMYESGKQKE